MCYLNCQTSHTIYDDKTSTISLGASSFFTGGWTQVLRVKSKTNNMTQFLKLPFKRWTNLAGFSPSGNYMIEPSALKNSALVGKDAQMRFHCSLANSSPKKTIHLVTTNDSLGKAVVNWLTGRSVVQPVACNSYRRLHDDVSYLSQHCSDWDQAKGKWGISQHDTPSNRFINHLIWISTKGHWNLFVDYYGPNRFDCDNQRSNVIQKGDFWQIFFR